ncbi:hypothetical protein BsWGS_18545 [Bradybaena similaris]
MCMERRNRNIVCKHTEETTMMNETRLKSRTLKCNPLVEQKALRKSIPIHDNWEEAFHQRELQGILNEIAIIIQSWIHEDMCSNSPTAGIFFLMTWTPRSIRIKWVEESILENQDGRCGDNVRHPSGADWCISGAQPAVVI